MHVSVGHNKARLELLPLLDVIFLVTVFLVYAMLDMSEIRALEANLPRSANADGQHGDFFTISILNDGSINIEDQSLTMAELERKIPECMAGGQLRHEQTVLVRADRNIVFKTVVDVLDILKGNGVTRVSIQVKNGR